MGLTSRKGKRRMPSEGASLPDTVSGLEMQELEQNLELKLTLPPSLVLDMDVREDRARLIQELWRGDYGRFLNQLTQANPGLVAMLDHLTSNTYRSKLDADGAARVQIQFDGVLNQLARVRSQKLMPTLTAVLSVCCLRANLPEWLWAAFSAFSKGLLASKTWAERLAQDSLEFRPPPNEPPIPRVAAAVFDNYTRRCLYKSLVSDGDGGYRLDMTNWGSLHLPCFLAHPQFNPFEACALSFFPASPCSPLGITLHTPWPFKWA